MTVRLIQKCGYLKKDVAGYLEYIATREGVELLPDRYMEYMAERPRSHGLFCGKDTVNLKDAMKEIAACPSAIWTVIWSLRREDAQRLGYDNAASWRQLILSRQTEIARAMKIPPDQLRWYAAFHDEGHHPHVHVAVWSADPKQGFLTRDGIKAMRSAMNNAIFQDELYALYQRKDVSYKEVTAAARRRMATLVEQMNSGICDSLSIAEKMVDLSKSLKSVSGRKVYGYLPKSIKAQVDAIVDEMAQLPEVAEYYAAWNQLRDELEGYYKDEPRLHLPLSQQKEFRAIKNAVIQEAEKLWVEMVAYVDDQAQAENGQTGSGKAEGGQADNSTLEEPDKRETGTVYPTAKKHREDVIRLSVTRLLHHMGRIFQETPLPANPKGIRMDSKRRKALQAKRLAMGHKIDDHEDIKMEQRGK